MLPERSTARASARLQLTLGDELRSVLDASPIATSIMRLDDSVLLYLNPAGSAFLGYPLEDLIGQKGSELGLWAVPTQRQLFLDKIRKEEVLQNEEIALLVRGEEPRTAIVSVQLVELNGETCVLSTFYDITERSELETALRETRDRFDDLARSVDDVFAVVEPEPLRFLYISPAVSGVFGVSPEAVLADAATLTAMVHPEDVPLVEGSFTPTAMSGQPTEMEHRIIRADGQVRWIWVRIWPILEPDGSFERFAVLIRDVTDRALLAQEEHRVAEAALDASRSKSEFLASMSHEIRTPLNGLIGMTGLLLQSALTSEQRQYAEIARGSGETLLALVDDILDFSKIEAGRLDLEAVEFDLPNVVGDVAELLEPAARAKGLELTLSIDPATDRFVVGDSVRLRQVLLNLVGNATKFTSAGHVVIRVAPEGDLVRFEIEDTGIGVEQAAIGSIFDSFTQADRSTTRRYGGTGLGLAICRRLTTMMGGEIGCRSALGLGSTFWFTCRLPATATQTMGSSRTLAGRRVLIVDDLEVNLTVLQAQLGAWGMIVTPTAYPARVVELLRDAARAGRPYDLVITDSDMPDLDGAALVAQIQQLAPPRPRAVVISSVGDREELRARLGEALAGYLTKPVRPSHLHDVLLDVLDRGQSARTQDRRAVPRDRDGLVLVVDDNSTNRFVAEAMLRRRGYRVEFAENGRQAVDAVAGTDYDAVLMDCEMPVLDGYSATAEIRAAEGAARHTLIVALTAAAMPGDAERALGAGMDAYVSKPITFDHLHDELDRLLSGRATPPTQAADQAIRPDSTGSVDVEPLTQLLNLDPSGGLVRRIVDVFVQEGPAYGEALRDGRARADVGAVERACHGLCGMACAVGAVVVTEQCRSVERLARSGALPTSEVIEALSEEVMRAAASLQAFVSDRTPAHT